MSLARRAKYQQRFLALPPYIKSVSNLMMECKVRGKSEYLTACHIPSLNVQLAWSNQSYTWPYRSSINRRALPPYKGLNPLHTTTLQYHSLSLMSLDHTRSTPHYTQWHTISHERHEYHQEYHHHHLYIISTTTLYMSSQLRVRTNLAVGVLTPAVAEACSFCRLHSPEAQS